MEEIKLWTLEKGKDGKLKAAPMDISNQTESENQLEELLVQCPDLLLPNLTVVGRQMPTEGGPLDLLGVNEDGRLVVFELKRGRLSRDAISQVIDYTSYLKSLDQDELCDHISECSGTGGIEKIENFHDWYQNTFSSSPDGLAESPLMALVGLGVDDRTKRMVDFLADQGVNINLFLFQGFEKDGKLFLARQIEVRESTASKTGHKYNKKENLEALEEKAIRLGVSVLLKNMKRFLQTEIGESYVWPSRSGYSYSLSEKTDKGMPTLRAYISMYMSNSQQGAVQLVFQKRAVKTAGESFSKFGSEHKDQLEKHHSGSCHIWVKSTDEWSRLENPIKPVIKAMLEGYRTKIQEEEE